MCLESLILRGGYFENKKRSSVEGTPPKGGYPGNLENPGYAFSMKNNNT